MNVHRFAFLSEATVFLALCENGAFALKENRFGRMHCSMVLMPAATLKIRLHERAYCT